MLKNYIGQEIGKFVILDQKRENNNTYLYCQCSKCNKQKWINLKHIKNTKCCESKTCSTQFQPLRLENKIVNGIKLIESTEKRKGTMVIWKCKCHCGKIFYAPGCKIKNGKIKNCGCAKTRYTPQNLEKAMRVFEEKSLKERYFFICYISKNTSDKYQWSYWSNLG